MKRIIIFLLMVCLSMSFSTGIAETQPKPIELIPYEELPPTLEGQHHYLLLCVDQWKAKSWNLGDTDGIIIVTLDTRAHRVMLTSIMRDSLVQHPDGKILRINSVAHRADNNPEALCQTISQHLGVKIEKYILFGFSQIQDIIDSMGGVDITINAEEAAYLKRYPINRNATTPAIRYSGTYHFNGHSAVIYMRMRKAGGHGDFTRTQRARRVLSTLADQCRNFTIDDANALVNSIAEHTTLTNLNMDEMRQAAEYAYNLRDCTIEELRIPPDGATRPITYWGMSVQELDWDTCRSVMSDFLVNSFLVMDEDADSLNLDDFDDFSNLD